MTGGARAFLAIGGGALLALVCVASAADRSGVPLDILPAPLAPRAAFLAAQRAVLAGDAEVARDRAVAAVAANPMDADAIALLGAAAVAAGDDAAAHSAFTVAAQLGWRNEATQLYWLGVGLELPDFSVAAERLDALLRSDRRSAATDLALAHLEASTPGRAALVAQLLAAPDWRDALVASTAGLTGARLAQRIAVLRQAGAAGMPLDCRVVARPVQALFAGGDFAAAARLWFGTCDRDQDAGQTVRDGGFERAGEGFGTAFEWQTHASGDMDVSVAQAPSPLRGMALRVAIQGNVPRAVASQAVGLAPGRYRIGARAVDAVGRESRAVRMTLACLGRGEDRLTADSRALPAEVKVPATACALQRLRWIVDPQLLGPERLVWIDDVSVTARPLAPQEQQRQHTTREPSFQGGSRP
jgi:hypothetical protein